MTDPNPVDIKYKEGSTKTRTPVISTKDIKSAEQNPNVSIQTEKYSLLFYKRITIEFSTKNRRMRLVRIMSIVRYVENISQRDGIWWTIP